MGICNWVIFGVRWEGWDFGERGLFLEGFLSGLRILMLFFIGRSRWRVMSDLFILFYILYNLFIIRIICT
jgi:hypothetical protein